MDRKELEQYLLLALNLALGIDHASSYTNSFDVKFVQDGFLFIPRVPTTFILNYELYIRVYMIINAVLYPVYTVLRENHTNFYEMPTDDIHLQRAFYYRLIPGISRRLIIEDIEAHVKNNVGDRIELMSNVSIDYSKCAHIGISGGSGAGKTTFLEYLLWNLKPISDLVLVDPKLDRPAIWAKKHGVKYISPLLNRSKSDFVAQASQILADCINLIKARQLEVFEKGPCNFRHLTIVFDEIGVMGLDVPKAVRESFQALLGEVALLGRSSRVHIIFVAQQLDFKTLDTRIRSQANFMFLLGNINSHTVQFMFPSCEVDGIIVPSGHGTGILQLIDDEHVPNILPFLAPTFFEK